MERFEFDNREVIGFPNSNRKNGITVRGAIELHPWLAPVSDHNFLTLDFHGPEGAERGSAVIDRVTAWKVGFALLKWANGADAYDPLGDLLAACEAVIKGEGTDDEILNQVAEAVAKVKAI